MQLIAIIIAVLCAGALALNSQLDNTLNESNTPINNNNNKNSSSSPNTTPGRSPPPRVRINKCCHYGEYLDETQSCVPGANSEHWVPLIFLVQRRTQYIPQGEAPKFISFEENARPSTSGPKESAAANHSSCTANELELFTGKGNIVLFSNGSLFVRERAQFIPPAAYCIDRDAALVCFPKPPHAAAGAAEHTPPLRLRKCCGNQGSYDAVAKTCRFGAGADANANSQKLLAVLEAPHTQLIYGFPACPEAATAYAIVGALPEATLNTSSGDLQLPHKSLAAAEYCLEHLLAAEAHAPAASVKIFACLHHFASAESRPSTAASAPSSDQLQVAALNIGLVISVVFLAATLAAGWLLPSAHHVLHWRCQIYYVFCLFVGDLLLAYTQLSSTLELGSAWCLFVASAMHFFFLSAFFWLNTMCFNIWWTFRDFRPSSLERNQEMLRLRLYSAYAWGIPLVISVIAAFVDQLPETSLLRPGFGVRSCWFSGEHWSILAYFFGPVGILLCANILLFVSTTHQLTCGLWKRDDVKSSSERSALGKVCLKLVVVMGVTWIAELISWLVGGPHSAWFVTDLVNALQGVFIFIVVGCQPQVWVALKRLCCPRSRQEITNTTNGVQHSSSSQGLPSLAACGGEITQHTSVGQSTTTTTTTATMPSTASSIGAGVGTGGTGCAGNQTHTKIPMETVC